MLWVSPAALAQPRGRLVGSVQSAETGEALPMVNIRVLDSTLGTITNAEGNYRLVLSPGSYRIVFSCMGFNSDTLHVSLGEETVHRDISLKRAILPLPDLVVYPETRNPAEEIIRKAIARKQDMLRELHSYRFDAYTRTKIWMELMSEGVREPEIVGLLETQTRGYWKAPDHYMETITARRQSATFRPAQNIFTSGLLPNFMKNRVVVGSNNVVGPLADAALDYYSYSIIDTTVADGRRVYRLKVEPKSQNLPLFQGTVAITDETFLLMQVEMSGNDAMDARPLHDWRFQQQFASYEERYWFPISSFLQFGIDLGVGLPIYAEMHAVLYDYGINEELPGGIFGRYTLQVEPTADEPDSTAWQGLQILPLTKEETAAYEQIEKDMEEAGPLGRLILALVNGLSGAGKMQFTAFSDFFRFNRVEGLYLGAGVALREPIPRTNLMLKGGYGFADRQGRYGIEVERILSRPAGLSVGAVSEHTLVYREGTGAYTPGEITAYALLNNIDPVDYYARRGWNAWLHAGPWGSLGLKLCYRNEFHESVAKNTDYSLLYPSRRYRDNSPVLNGRLRSAGVIMDLDTRKFYNTGSIEVPIEESNYWRIQSDLEISRGADWKSDFSFRRAALTIRRHQFTFGSGYMLMVLRGGYSTGRLPPQRLFDLIGGLGEWYKSEHFATLNPREFAGDRMGMLWVEHNFRSMPLRALGIRPTGSLNIDFLLRAAVGWCGFRCPEDAALTYLDKAVEETHWEVGIGIGRIYTFLRLDFAWRLTSGQGRVFVVSIGGGF